VIQPESSESSVFKEQEREALSPLTLIIAWTLSNVEMYLKSCKTINQRL